MGSASVVAREYILILIITESESTKFGMLSLCGKKTKNVTFMGRYNFSVRVYQPLNLMTHGPGILVLGYGHLRVTLKTKLFKKYSSLFPDIDRTWYIVLKTKNMSTKILNLLTPGTKVVV